MGPKDADGMGNCVDPDQTAPLEAVEEQSDLGLHCLPSLSVRKLRFITIEYLGRLTRTKYSTKNIYYKLTLRTLWYETQFQQNYTHYKIKPIKFSLRKKIWTEI